MSDPGMDPPVIDLTLLAPGSALAALAIRELVAFLVKKLKTDDDENKHFHGEMQKELSEVKTQVALLTKTVDQLTEQLAEATKVVHELSNANARLQAILEEREKRDDA